MVCESVFLILFLISASLLLLQPEPATDLILPWFLHLTLPFPTSYDSDGLCFAFAKLGFPGSRTASVEEEELEQDWFATTHFDYVPFFYSNRSILLGGSDLYGDRVGEERE